MAERVEGWRVRRGRRGWWIVLLAVAAGCGGGERGPGSAAPSPATSAATLHAVTDEMWRHALDTQPLLRLREGIPIERLADLSYQAAERDVELAKGWLARLEAITPESLDEGDRTTRDALRWDLGIEIEGLQYFWHEMVVTSYQSPLPSLRQIFGSFTFEASTDVDRYLSVLGQVPALVAALEQRVRGQLEHGIAVSRQNLPQSTALAKSFLGSGPGGPFGVAPARVESLAQADRDRLAAGVRAEVEQRIDPALESLVGLLENEVAAAAPEGVGASQYPGGEAYYRFAVRRSTTLDISPEEVHQIGLAMVAELEAAMDGVRHEVGFSGSREEFHRMLRTDPRFFPKTPEEVGERITRAAHDMDARVDTLFERRPQAPYGAERLDPALEGSQTYGYYDPPNPQEPRGIYYYNGSRLDQRSWIGLEAIALHELIPGHHFQIARQMENRALPDIRRNAFHGAYTEGWGSYSSYLGQEAGLYQDPYSRYGMFVLEIFLASRLVVDTGMNLMGWSLEQGRQYQLDHTLESETQIASESLRYSTDMPAQALAYQMGKRKLLELRVRAAEKLGDRFDVRRFHEVVLGQGSLPLAVLEQRVDEYIEHEGAGTGA